jgi:hypothetical protein
MDKATFDKSALVRRDESGKVGGKAVSCSFGDNFPNAMDKADRAVVREGDWVRFFWV